MLENQKQPKEEWILYPADQKELKRCELNILLYCRIHAKTHSLFPCLIHSFTWILNPMVYNFFLLLPYTSNPSQYMQTTPEMSLKSMGQNSGMRKYLIFKNRRSYSVLGVNGGLHWGIPEIFLGNRAFSWQQGHLCGLRAAGHTYYGIFFPSGLNLWFYRLSADMYHDWLSEALFRNWGMWTCVG